jgi:serine/threonine-protein kinase
MGNTAPMPGGKTGTGALPPRYVDGRHIGRGGMGEILLVQDRELNRPVVIKLLGDQYTLDASLVRRFTREAHAAARLSGHPHVVTIYDIGEWEGRPFIAMEHVPGGDLRERLDREAVDVQQALRWLRQAASALDDAHKLGVVHRDVKPANLLLDAGGDLRVGDFGIARVLDEATAAMTLPGTIIGTAGYLSPEQARGDVATAASDLYSLGVVAFELLTGRRPFERDSTADEMSAHANEPPPSARSVSPRLPKRVDAVFERVLAKDARHRQPNAGAFVDELEYALTVQPQPTITAPPPAAPERIVPLPGDRSGWGWPVLALVGLVMLAVGFAGVRLVLDRGDGASVQTVTRKVTTQGTTRVETQTATEPATSSTPALTPPRESAATGRSLNDRAFAMMRDGEYNRALPLLRRSVRALRGVGFPYEAWANFNLGYTLVRLGRCGEALPPLWRSRKLQKRSEVKQAIRVARRCA